MTKTLYKRTVANTSAISWQQAAHTTYHILATEHKPHTKKPEQNVGEFLEEKSEENG